MPRSNQSTARKAERDGESIKKRPSGHRTINWLGYGRKLAAGNNQRRREALMAKTNGKTVSKANPKAVIPISSSAKNYINSIFYTIINSVAKQCGDTCNISRRKTIRSKDIITCICSTLHPKYQAEVISRIERPVQKYRTWKYNMIKNGTLDNVIHDK